MAEVARAEAVYGIVNELQSFTSLVGEIQRRLESDNAFANDEVRDAVFRILGVLGTLARDMQGISEAMEGGAVPGDAVEAKVGDILTCLEAFDRVMAHNEMVLERIGSAGRQMGRHGRNAQDSIRDLGERALAR